MTEKLGVEVKGCLYTVLVEKLDKPYVLGNTVVIAKGYRLHFSVEHIILLFAVRYEYPTPVLIFCPGQRFCVAICKRLFANAFDESVRLVKHFFKVVKIKLFRGNLLGEKVNAAGLLFLWGGGTGYIFAEEIYDVLYGIL